MERIHERVAGHPGKRRRWRLLQIALAGPAEEQQLSAWPQEGLKRVECSSFDANSADGDEIERFMELRAWEKLFKSCRFDQCVAESKRANGFPKEHGLAGLDLDQSQRQVGAGKLQGNCRRAASRA